MAVLSSSYPNIVDLMKQTDPDGSLARFANLLAQTNQMLAMMPYVQANNKTHHRVTQLVSLPQTTERGLNEGTIATKHEMAQHDEGITLLDQWAVVDVELARLSRDPNAYRAARVKTGIESLNQRCQFLSIYGDQATNPKQFTGLFARRPSIASQLVVNCGGATANNQSSMYLLCASPETIYYVFPDGSPGGLEHVDHGVQVEQNQGGVTGAQMAAFKDQLKWNVGIAEEDSRCAIRLCNIDVPGITDLTGTQAPGLFTNLIHKMMIALDRLPMGIGGDKFFIANRTVRTGLARLAMEKSTNALSLVEAQTQMGTTTEVLKFMGSIPVLLVDQLSTTEAVVAA